ncbi:MAG TPA: GNAT family N-acetyltransferase [Bacillaceae bacterium]|nr:GNAT family N-acetyltransferase [Paenibacillus bovis]HLU20992.1 GNAT family N-acetyltransferase [Bacillaceae bacterium]
MDHTLVFCEINMNHIPVVNSWYHDNTDSSYVEELTESFVMYVASNPNHYCWIVYQNNVPVGKVTYEIVEQKAYIDILIRPDYRRKGLGKRIIEKVISRSEISSIKQIVAGIKHTNTASINLFKSVGFDAEGSEIDSDGGNIV